MAGIPDGDEILTRLRQLDRRRAKEVLRSAFRGEAHDDREVAALVVGWVRFVRGSFWTWRSSRLQTVVVVVLAAGLWS